MTLTEPSEPELRRAAALILADVLRWTEPLSEEVRGELRRWLRRLASELPFTVREEAEMQRRLLSSGARLTGPFDRSRWEG